jgi:hypothetical protein
MLAEAGQWGIASIWGRKFLLFHDTFSDKKGGCETYYMLLRGKRERQDPHTVRLKMITAHSSKPMLRSSPLSVMELFPAVPSPSEFIVVGSRRS